MRRFEMLIVDDNLEMRRLLSDYFDTAENIKICGIAENGAQAYEMLDKLEPDVVLLDLIMPMMDGMAFLDRFNLKYKSGNRRKPKIIVISAIGSEAIIKDAFERNVDYFVMKPFDFRALQGVIISMCATKEELHVPVKNPANVSRSITELLSSLDINMSNFGYKYLKFALGETVSHGNRIMTAKEIYNIIADEYTTTVECAEKAMRNSVRTAYLKNPDNFKVLGYSGDKPPTMSLFFTAVSEYLGNC